LCNKILEKICNPTEVYFCTWEEFHIQEICVPNMRNCLSARLSGWKWVSHLKYCILGHEKISADLDMYQVVDFSKINASEYGALKTTKTSIGSSNKLDG